MMTQILETAILPWLFAFATALAPALFALALVWLRQHHINTSLLAAAGQAAGEAYKQMVTAGAPVTDAASLNAAVAAGVEQMLANLPAALERAKMTPATAAAMVSGELGRLLAIDPTVGVGVAK